MSTLSTIKDVREETTRSFDIDGTAFVATKDQMYSLWRLTANKMPLPGAYTTWPKTMEAAEVYAREKSLPVAPTQMKKELKGKQSQTVKENVDG